MAALTTASARRADQYPPRPLRAAFAALVWGLAAAAVAGFVWWVTIQLTPHLSGTRAEILFAISTLPLRYCLIWLAIATASGLVLGAAAAALSRRGGMGVFEGSLWGTLAGLGLGLTVLAVPFVAGRTHEFVTPLVSSALLFAVWGFLAGSSAAIWSRWTAEREDGGRDEDFDEPAQEAGAGVAWVPEERPRRTNRGTRAALRLLPSGAVALGSLAGAAVLAPEPSALGLLAAGLLGLALFPVLWEQERRLDALERRPRRERSR